MESEGVSSIKSGAFSRSFTFTLSCSYLCCSNFPVRNFSEDKPVSDEIKRVINCTLDISNEKKATPLLESIAIFRAIDNTKAVFPRSEEHTSELQSRPHLVCRLLLEKKKKNT